MENKIIDLESKLAFQDETINELNEVITDQQNQLDVLREEIRLLNLRISSVAEASNVSEEKEPPPPHY
ncbi:MAG: SlyX family protein [Gammaproteobacteria bacterium]|nr:SlyX family protein [Gammaproteobacteria bacterium]MDH5659548.1 SlyX family protein [Gammaproteobacteria bacterium]